MRENREKLSSLPQSKIIKNSRKTGAKTVKKNYRAGKKVGSTIGRGLSKAMQGTGPRKTTF